MSHDIPALGRALAQQVRARRANAITRAVRLTLLTAPRYVFHTDVQYVNEQLWGYPRLVRFQEQVAKDLEDCRTFRGTLGRVVTNQFIGI